jgi:acyl carrier protein
MDENSIFKKIKELIHEIDSAVVVTEKASLRDDLELDSADVLSLYFEFEKAFNIEIPDSDLEENNLDVISDIMEYIKKNLTPPQKN